MRSNLYIKNKLFDILIIKGYNQEVDSRTIISIKNKKNKVVGEL